MSLRGAMWSRQPLTALGPALSKYQSTDLSRLAVMPGTINISVFEVDNDDDSQATTTPLAGEKGIQSAASAPY